MIYTATPEQTGWRIVFSATGEPHVVPADELEQHDPENCRCCPREDDGVIVHSSFDGREKFETGERKPS